MQEDECDEKDDEMVNMMVKRSWDSGVDQMMQALKEDDRWGLLSEVRAVVDIKGAVYDDISGQELDA
jgi:hypothetical protein